ncbi:MAG TPA: STAS domain-containing protein [Catenuloplanes sp.]|jgi:anti-anti-sigma factor
MSAEDPLAGQLSHEHGPPVAIARQGGTHLVRLAGEIDLANADPIGEHVLSETGQARAVLLDLTAVGFLDSAGVRLLDRLIGAYEDRGLPVRVLVAPRGPVLLTLTLCGFREDLVRTDFAGAVAALRGIA